jgi:hypothetical protein
MISLLVVLEIYFETNKSIFSNIMNIKIKKNFLNKYNNLTSVNFFNLTDVIKQA